MIIAILAGNKQQFEEYVRKFGKKENEHVYISKVQDCFGKRFNAVETIGTFNERPDSWKLYHNIAARLVDN